MQTQRRDSYTGSTAALFIKEADVLSELKWLLTILQNQGKLKFVRINVSPIIRGSGVTKVFLKNKEMVGLPDLMIWMKAGPCLCVEVKRPRKGVQSPEQKKFQMDLQALGHVYRIITSFKEMELLLAEHGCRL